MDQRPAEVLTDRTPAALAAAVHDAMIEHIVSIPSVLPEWQLEQDGPFTLLYHRHAPTPLDGIIRAQLDPQQADAQIAAVLARFRRKGRSVFWITGAPQELPDLPQRLQAHGLHLLDTVPGMAVDLAELPAAEPLPAGLTITPVRDDADHATLAQLQVDTMGEAFGPRAMLKRAFGLDAAGAVQHYLSRLNERPVAAATAVYAGGVLALYGIGTLPDVRGRGVGRAITLHACLEARRRGYQIATLHATPLGLPVYRKLGFTEHGQTQFFVAPAPQR